MCQESNDLAYLAGVIDSDGCIGVYRVKARGDHVTYQPKVQIRQVQSEAIDLAHSLFSGHVYRHKAQTERGKPLWVWQVHSAAVSPTLTALLPYLRIKKPRAENALRCCEINAGRVRTFPVPEIVPGEPMVSVSEAARRLGKSYETVYQAVDHRTVPFIRGPRSGRKPSILIPESYLETWANRGRSPQRLPEVTAQLEAVYLRAKELNRVGV